VPNGPVRLDALYVHDRDADGNGVFDEPGGFATVLLSVAADGTHDFNAESPDLSDDGRFVAFSTTAALVADDTNGERDVYVRDRDADGDGIFDEPDAVGIERVSVSSAGAQGDGESGRSEIRISGDGRVVAFLSYASNLVPNDTNHQRDIFVHDRVTGAPSA
jgi:WD40-like Beta Propeller Repeat